MPAASLMLYDFHPLFLFVFLLWAGIYFIPTIVAYSRRVTNAGSVLVVNVFLGWTFIGWIVALAMAVRTDTRPVVMHVGAPDSGSSATSGGPPAYRATPPSPSAQFCPRCGQQLQADYRFCPFCGGPASSMQ